MIPTRPFFAEILRGSPMTLLDIGAAEGLQPQWHPLIGENDFYLFEPDPRSRQGIEAWVSSTGSAERFHVVDKAFSDGQGKEKIALTNVRTGSTLMAIDEKSEGFKHLNKSYFFPMEQVEIETTTVDSFAQENKLEPRALKVDVQGAEFRVLQGASEALKNVLCLDFEVGVVNLYRGQVSHSEIFDYLEKLGFSLFDVRVSRSFLNKDGNPHHYLGLVKDSLKNQAMSARAWEFDCVFFKRAEWVLAQKDVGMIRQMVALYCAYKFFAEALELIESARVQGLIDESLFSVLHKSVMKLYEINGKTNRWSFFTRRVRELFGRSRDHYWARFVWMRYPHS